MEGLITGPGEGDLKSVSTVWDTDCVFLASAAIELLASGQGR